MQDDKVTPRHQSMAEALQDLEVHEWTVRASCKDKRIGTRMALPGDWQRRALAA
ncbi:unnamed protein product, partial [Symbiodinium microadriaticum]